MTHSFEPPIIGQEAVCPDGLGRVSAFRDAFPSQWIRVETYYNNRSCAWSPENVTLLWTEGLREYQRHQP